MISKTTTIERTDRGLRVWQVTRWRFLGIVFFKSSVQLNRG